MGWTGNGSSTRILAREHGSRRVGVACTGYVDDTEASGSGAASPGIDAAHISSLHLGEFGTAREPAEDKGIGSRELKDGEESGCQSQLDGRGKEIHSDGNCKGTVRKRTVRCDLEKTLFRGHGKSYMGRAI